MVFAAVTVALAVMTLSAHVGFSVSPYGLSMPVDAAVHAPKAEATVHQMPGLLTLCEILNNQKQKKRGCYFLAQ
jgi:hypothetical protein